MPGLKQLPPSSGDRDDAPTVSATSAHELIRSDFASMSPDQQQDEVRRIVREAHAERTRLVRAVFCMLLAWVWSATMFAGRAARYLATRLVAALIGCSQAYANHRRCMRAAAELRALGDRELKDIGVYRSGIDWAITHGRDNGSVGPSGTVRPVLMRSPVPARQATTREVSETAEQKRRAA